MKKGLIIPLATACILSLAGTALAAENPFATVPAKHWAYESVVKLVHDGLIDGYADGDFRGDKPATRYEMAVLTAKAMSNLQKADAKDKEALDKLQKEFSNELTQLNVRVNNVEKDLKKVKAKSDKFDFSGYAYARYDHKSQIDGSGDSTKKTGPKDFNYYIELVNKFDIGDGWVVQANFVGVKDSEGNDRTSENISDFGLTRLNMKGQLGGGTLEVGRDKGGILNNMVMGEYYTGMNYSFGNKLKAKVTYGKPDYESTSDKYLTDKNGNIVTNDGVSVLNPDDPGIKVTNIKPLDISTRFTSLDLKYSLSKASEIAGAYYYTSSGSDSYKNAKIWEVAYKTKLSPNFTLLLDHARSNYTGNNTANDVKLTYKGANKNNPGSYGLSVDYLRMGQNSYIKTTYDINDSTNGAKGYQYIYQYIPKKDVTFMVRWIDFKTMSGTYSRTKFLRTQLQFNF
ncbi:MAG: S-layer protein [Firmicutes bacterium]|nr:S-layer protein [Bacillota bacterium]